MLWSRATAITIAAHSFLAILTGIMLIMPPSDRSLSHSLTGSTAPGCPASKRKAHAFPGQFHFATFTLLYARVSTAPALLL
jgi:hypothetical protein